MKNLAKLIKIEKFIELIKIKKLVRLLNAKKLIELIKLARLEKIEEKKIGLLLLTKLKLKKLK